MGSGSSRGKRVAPACASEVSKTRAFKRDTRIFKPLNIHGILRSSRAPAEDGGPDAAAAGCHTETKKSAFVKVRTYGLCSFGGGDSEEDPNCTVHATIETKKSRGSGDLNKISHDAFTNFTRRAHPNSTHLRPASQNRGSSLGAVSTSENHCSSLTAPEALYDRSDVELMDTIERDFS
ncbi:uncharacterized protein ACB058_017200 [Synchiropus picturatus]